MTTPSITQLPITRLHGRTVLITGATRGVGYEVARVCAAAGASVTLAVRDIDRGVRAAARMGGDVAVARLDLADLSSVRAFGETWTEPVDVLVNNAGIMMVPKARTADGFEAHLGVNHLGHFALTGLLLPWVRNRIVIVGSQAHRQARLDLDDLQWHRRAYHPFQAYADSKLACLSLVLALSRRLSGVGVFGAHPGWVKTDLVSPEPGPVRTLMRVGTRLLARDAVAGAEPILHAMTQDLPSGSYVGPSGWYEFWGPPTLVGRSSAAADVTLADQLWDASVRATGVQPGPAIARAAELRAL